MRGQQQTGTRGKVVETGVAGASSQRPLSRRRMIERLNNLPTARKVEFFDTLTKAWASGLHEVLFADAAPIDNTRPAAGRGRGIQA